MQFGRPLYIEQLDTIDIPAMYKVTTQKRLLQNLVVEYEKFEDIKLVYQPWKSLMNSLLVVVKKGGQWKLALRSSI